MEYPNWFASTPAQENFNNFLSHLKDKPDLNFLQLGVYTGDATVWLMENVITHESSTLTDVDTWKGSDEDAHHVIDFNEIFEFYRERTSRYNPRLQWFRGRTIDFLRYDEEQYDFIYVDADHTAIGVLLDAELSWDLLKPKGILAFDDYQWSEGKGDAYRPMPGINSFLDRHKEELDIVHSGWQLWVVKR